MLSVILTTTLNPPPHYFFPSFLFILLTTSLPLSHPPHYPSPSVLSIFLTTSPSFIPLNPPPHYLSSLSCNIIIHFITSVFLPSPSSLLTLPNCLSPSFFSILFLITFSVYFSPPSSSSSSLLPPPHYFSPPRLPLSLRPFYPLPSNLLFTTCFTTSSALSPSFSISFYHSPSVLSILLFIFIPSCPLPHTCQLCLPALSKLEFFSLTLRKIALSLKSVFHILSSYLLIRSHSMFMLALVIAIVIVDALFRPHLTIMSSTIYMYRSVYKKNPIKIGEEEKLVWVGNENVLTHTWFSGGKFSIYSFLRGKTEYILIFPGEKMSMGEK